MQDKLLLILKRLHSSSKGTFGELWKGNSVIALTCEDPWEDNAKGHSCIPPGLYEVAPHSGAKWKNVWEIQGVPNRSAILIHSGNTILDTEGCILVGGAFGSLNGLPAVLGSKDTLRHLQRILPGNFSLKVEAPNEQTA